MDNLSPWPRRLLLIGTIAMFVGLLDPMEGSVVILAGVALAALAARALHSRYSSVLYWALALTLGGVGALWGWSAVGGFGGPSGRSMWWILTLVPYPIGFLIGVIGSIRALRESRGTVAAA